MNGQNWQDKAAEFLSGVVWLVYLMGLVYSVVLF